MNESNTSSAHLYNLLQQDAKVKPHITKSLTLISSVIKKYGYILFLFIYLFFF